MFPSMKEPFLPPIPREIEFSELEFQWVNTLSSVHQLIHKTERTLGVLHDNSRAVAQALDALQAAKHDLDDLICVYNLEKDA